MIATSERILVIADADRQLQAALEMVRPQAQVITVPNVFDGIAELAGGNFSSVFVPAEPIERRPEAAVSTLRQLAGHSRVYLFGHPTLEPLSRKMLEFGADDYVVTPASASEIEQLLAAAPALRLMPAPPLPDKPEEDASADAVDASQTGLEKLQTLPLAEILLDALLHHPHDSLAAAVREINHRLASTPSARPSNDFHLLLSRDGKPPASGNDLLVHSHAIHQESNPALVLHLLVPQQADQSAARHLLAQIGSMLGRCAALDQRHNQLQRLAIMDDLTGLYNGRYFRHFLSKVTDRARQLRFPVTLLMFDIDNFKRYNDAFGHGVGDEILRQTAGLMRRCCREHDLVARVAGDEFAVVFWDKEGPRQPRDPSVAPSGSRVPQTIVQILQRFQRLISSPDFRDLGLTGKGVLTISGGLAVFPYDAGNADDLIQAADRALMFGAKRGGKNSIYLVGGQDPHRVE